MFFSLLIGALMVGSVYALLALGYSLIYRASNLMTFMQGALFMLGAFIGLTLYKNLKLPFALAFALTIAIMFCLGVLLEKAVIRPMLNKGASEIYIVLATIALSTILENTAMLVWGSNTFQFPQIFSNAFLEIGGVRIAPELLLALGVGVACMLALHFFMGKSRFGTAMRAAAQDSRAAGAMGINVSLTTGVTWGIAAALAACGGILYGPVYGVNMSMGTSLGLKGFAGAVIGGYGNMYGAIFGSLLLGVIETFVAGYISSAYKDFIAFILLILILFIRPRGLFKSDIIA